jgi:hypothetical protein
MAQNTKEERLRIAQIEIVQAYINSLTYSNGNPLNTRTQYANVTNALDALNPQYLKQLTEKLATGKRIEKLLDKIDSEKNSLKKTYKTYVTQFVSYLRNPSNVTSLNKICKNYLEAKKNATLINNAETIYFHNALFTSFKGRLRSQERLSGNKIWLPLDFIAKLYSMYSINNTGKTTPFTKWLGDLVDGIYVHYLDNSNNKVKSKQFNDPNISLILKANINNSSDVYLRVFNKNNWTDYPVLTPTGDGNKKDYMVVKDISEIDIDHVKPIDQSLRELDNKGLLTCLKDVSNFYKNNIPQKANAGDLNKAARIFAKNKGANFSVFLNDLLYELDLLGNDSPLRLMSDVYNSQKSNAFPYEKIIYDNRVYYGILRTGIKDPIIVNRNYEIYQILNDDFQNSGVTYVRQQSSITKRPINKLNKIINYI